MSVERYPYDAPPHLHARLGATVVKVLVVTRDNAQAAALEARFRKRLGPGLEFEHLRSGARAAERLAHTPADVVVCAKGTDDIPGAELLQRVRLGCESAFILLDRGALPGFTPGRLDAVLDACAHPADVLEAAFSLMVAGGRLEDAPRPFHGTFPGGPRGGRDVKVSGTLEVVTLYDLVLSLTQKRNSGRLYLLLGRVEALLAFDQGRFVHAEYQELTGEAAVMKVFWEAELHPSTEFFFEPSEVRLPPGGATLHLSVQEILLKVAVGLDHRREPSTGK